jgi:enoyl-CoA hydratase/carnithine racemase
MKAWKNFILQEDEGIALLTINRPEKANSFHLEAFEELALILEGLEKEESVRVLICTGAGKNFSAGVDIGLLNRLPAEDARGFVYSGTELLKRLEKSRMITIAAINGPALGGGFIFTFPFDIRISSDRAFFAITEVAFGVVPTWGGTQRLARLVGAGLAKEILFTGDRFRAEEAHRIGLINKIVPHDTLIPYCQGLARRIMAHAPLAIERTKIAINEGLQMPLDQALQYEAELWLANFYTEDREEGTRSFGEKRKPNFKGR